MSGDEKSYVVKVRGLPWSATVNEIQVFFESVTFKGGLEGIHLTISPEGRPSGEAYLELENEEDYKKALEKHKERMGHRFVLVLESTKEDMELAIKNSEVNAENSLMDACVRLRDLPYGCTTEEISNFFEGFNIVPNGIILPKNHVGQPTGQAFVQFVSKEVAEKAMNKHKEKVGERCVEVLKSSLKEMELTCRMMSLKRRGIYPKWPLKRNRFRNSRYFGGRNDSPFYRRRTSYSNVDKSYGDCDFSADDCYFFDTSDDPISDESSNKTSHKIRMRGLPFEATDSDISGFFNSVDVNVVGICILKDRSGQHSGEADVYFNSHEDAVQAMSKDRENMHNRYIELFLNSEQSRNKDEQRDAVGTAGNFHDFSSNFGDVNSLIGGSNFFKF